VHQSAGGDTFFRTREARRASEREHQLDATAVVRRLIEHPHPNMAGFVMELLALGPEVPMPPLPELEDFLRATLLAPGPRAAVKGRILRFIVESGLADERQAPVAIALLSEVAKLQVRGDCERAREGLVRLRLVYPHLASPVTVNTGGRLA
jgi:hypothetical protein